MTRSFSRNGSPAFSALTRAVGVAPSRGLSNRRGAGRGADLREVVASGAIADIVDNEKSKIGPFLSGAAQVQVRQCAAEDEIFELGKIHLSTGAIHTVHPLEVDIPKGRLTVVTRVSGSGKTTLILESLIPAL